MITYIELILSAFGGAVVAIAAVAFLGKQFINIQVSKVIEDYKSQLEQRSAVLKTELSIYAHEQNVGLSRIDEQRSKAIELIYRKITKWHDLFVDITAPEDQFDVTPDLEFNRFFGMAGKLAKLSEELTISVRNSAIYFDSSVYETISNYGASLSKLGLQFYAETFEELDISSEPNYDYITSTVRNARENLFTGARGDLEDLRNMLLAEFRSLMKAEYKMPDKVIHPTSG